MARLEDSVSLSLKWEGRVRELVGRNSVVPASFALDTSESTDLLLLSHAAGSIGMRTRSPSALKHDPWDFTIRTRSIHGRETEYDKLMAGMCSWFFYGVLNKDETDFQRWMLINLSVWRSAMRKYESERGWKPYSLRRNGDGTEFHVYKATNIRFQSDLFMIDCHDHSFPGRVAARNSMRSGSQEDVARFLNKGRNMPA